MLATTQATVKTMKIKRKRLNPSRKLITIYSNVRYNPKELRDDNDE